MMDKPHRLALAALLALGGCGHSPQTHLLTLDLAPPLASSPYGGPAIRLTAVQIPPAIDRLEFVSAVSPTELQIQDQYRWSASLGSLARDALLRDLTARMPSGMVLPPDSPASRGVARIDVAILALAHMQQVTRMEAVVTIAEDGGPRLLHRQFTLAREHPSSIDPAEAAAETSSMLGELADGIVVSLGQMQVDGTRRAPGL